MKCLYDLAFDYVENEMKNPKAMYQNFSITNDHII